MKKMTEIVEVDLRKDPNSSYLILEDRFYEFWIDDVEVLEGMYSFIREALEIEKTVNEEYSPSALDEDIRKVYEAINKGYIPVYFTSKYDDVPLFYDSPSGRKYMFVLPDYPTYFKLKRILGI